MSRRRKPNEVVNLFKDSFEVTFVHKPNMEPENTFYYFILEDKVRIRLKQFGTIIVIDEIVPMTTEYISSFYERLVDMLVKQDKFTVLISAMGNTHAIDSALVAIDAPVVEDKRFITIPEAYYDRMRDYYKDDLSKYGFYLLAVNEEAVEKEPDSSVPQESTVASLDDIPEPELVPVKIGVTPLMMRIKDVLKERFGEINVIDKDVLHDVQFNINDIGFTLRIPISENHIDVTKFVMGKEYRYTDLVQLMTTFVGFLDECPDIEVSDITVAVVDQVCSFLGFAPQKPKAGSNRAWNTIGSYKITKIST